MMEPAAQQSHPVPEEGRDLSLWAAVLGSPFLFLCHLQINYVLVGWACAARKKWVLYVVSACVLAAIAWGGLISWASLRATRGTASEADVPVPLGRHRTLAILGVMSSAVFFLVVLAQALAAIILDPCPE